MANNKKSRRDPGTFWTAVCVLGLYVFWGHGFQRTEALVAEPPKRIIEGLDASLTVPTTGYEYSENAKSGRLIYEQHCIGCHGVAGGGDGPAAQWLAPKPRNFTSGVFKFSTTRPGTLPSHDDLMKTVTQGLPGSSMPSFRLLPEADRQNVVEYVLTLARNSRRWKILKNLVTEAMDDADEEEPLTQELIDETLEDNKDILNISLGVNLYPATPETEFTKAGLIRGAKKYKGYCASCHGENGLGGPIMNGKEMTYDDFGEPNIARNLREEPYRHGRTARDLWFRIKRGLEGAVMPGASGWTSDEAWDCAHYVQLISDPKLREKYKNQFTAIAIEKAAGLNQPKKAKK